MNLEIRSLKVIEEMSEETVAFTGELFVDGVFAARLRNDGHGGATSSYFNSRATEEAVYAFCKSLPALRDTIDEQTIDLPMDFDFWCACEVDRLEEERIANAEAARRRTLKSSGGRALRNARAGGR
jgi:hypothetical protein